MSSRPSLACRPNSFTALEYRLAFFCSTRTSQTASATKYCSSMPTASSPRARTRTRSAPRTSRRLTTSSPTSWRCQSYSRLVDVSEIKGHDWNLNIRRYVDNMPEPEPEDVRAHLLGGVPKAEVAAKVSLLRKFGVCPELVFHDRDERYYDFKPEITSKETVKALVEADPNVRRTLDEMGVHLASWWESAQKDFARLAPALSPPSLAGDGTEMSNNQEPKSGSREGFASFLMLQGRYLPEVRRALISSLIQQ